MADYNSNDFFRRSCMLQLSGGGEWAYTIICDGECYWDGSSTSYGDPMSWTQLIIAFEDAEEEHDEYVRNKNG